MFSLRGAAGLRLFIVVATAFASASAYGNTGTQLPLSQYQAGTEQTTLVPDGDFENGLGTAWTLAGDYTFNAPINPPSNASAVGGKAAQTHSIDAGDDISDDVEQPFTVDINTTYVLSGYIWNFENNATPQGTSAFVFLRGSAETVEIRLAGETGSVFDRPGAADGYFVYTTFDGALFPTGGTIVVRGVGDGVDETYAQFDNIAITPESQFVAPVPEPGVAGILMLGLAAALGVRRRPN